VMVHPSDSEAWKALDDFDPNFARDNFRPSHLTCIAYVRHVGLKRVTHRFRYSTYAFNRTLHMKKRDLIPALLRSGAIELNYRCETLIPEAAKKNNSHN
jgi:hypothetical protein